MVITLFSFSDYLHLLNLESNSVQLVPLFDANRTGCVTELEWWSNNNKNNKYTKPEGNKNQFRLDCTREQKVNVIWLEIFSVSRIEQYDQILQFSYTHLIIQMPQCNTSVWLYYTCMQQNLCIYFQNWTHENFMWISTLYTYFACNLTIFVPKSCSALK